MKYASFLKISQSVQCRTVAVKYEQISKNKTSISFILPNLNSTTQSQKGILLKKFQNDDFLKTLPKEI